ncbi:MAG: glutathione S-transferase family protein [Thiofilum sp.]|uniref:glutathione S-transferase family protein n=1 Tax=Thiofilum sp. TaxID=2212733 RepID=UPI0025E30EDD|nr:glutathione S-transferase family protein [Thiofilum sp.]MBK8453395.1 glutathione S-transferase family protein [Thiofilum sp.]
MSHHLRLVSFKLCPFVQRSVIVLNYCQIPYEIDYIDLMNPPDWFKALSPLGKVPIVQVDHERVIFESAVIMELVSELNPPLLHPHDLLDKAHNRAWIEYGSAMLGTQYELVIAQDEPSFSKALNTLKEQLGRVEQQMHATPFFNGEQLNLIDAAYAPLFMRLAALDKHHALHALANTPKVKAWAEHLLALDAVKTSVVDDFEPLFYQMLHKRKSYLAQFVPA